MTRSAFAKAENLPGRTINYLPTQEEHRSVPSSTRKVKPLACKTRGSKPRACKTRASMPRACKSKTDQNEDKPGRTVNHISRKIPSRSLIAEAQEVVDWVAQQLVDRVGQNDDKEPEWWVSAELVDWMEQNEEQELLRFVDVPQVLVDWMEQNEELELEVVREDLPGRTINYLPPVSEHRSVPTSTRKVKPQACKTRASKPRACKSKTDQNEDKPGRTVNHISREIPSDFLDNLSLNTTMFVTRNIDPDGLD